MPTIYASTVEFASQVVNDDLHITLCTEAREATPAGDYYYVLSDGGEGDFMVTDTSGGVWSLREQGPWSASSAGVEANFATTEGSGYHEVVIEVENATNAARRTKKIYIKIKPVDDAG